MSQDLSDRFGCGQYRSPLSKPLPSSFSDCEAYGGAVKIIAIIEDPVVIKQILAPLQGKVESKELNPLPESRVSGVCRKPK